MEYFEKVEKLVQIANVSFEDAKKALDESNGDILDAMIALEKAGKVNRPQQSAYSTGGAYQSPYRDVNSVIEQNNQNNHSAGKNFFKDVGNAIKRGFQYTIDNSVKVVRNNVEIINIPLWLSIILMLAAWELLIIVIIVSLFFDCRYSIVGKDEIDDLNRIISQAETFAGKVKDSFNESFNAAPQGAPASSANSAAGAGAAGGNAAYAGAAGSNAAGAGATDGNAADAGSANGKVDLQKSDNDNNIEIL